MRSWGALLVGGTVLSLAACAAIAGIDEPTARSEDEAGSSSDASGGADAEALDAAGASLCCSWIDAGTHVTSCDSEAGAWGCYLDASSVALACDNVGPIDICAIGDRCVIPNAFSYGEVTLCDAGPPIDACAIEHSNGVGQSFVDCVAVDTFNQTQAVEACAAYTGNQAECSPAGCLASDGGSSGNAVCSDGFVAGNCVCWQYDAPFAGHLYNSMMSPGTGGANCFCPLGANSLTWH